MSTDGSNGPDKFRWKLDPPSMNTMTKYDPRIGVGSYKMNRRYMIRDGELNLVNWNLFELAGLNFFLAVLLEILPLCSCCDLEITLCNRFLEFTSAIIV